MKQWYVFRVRTGHARESAQFADTIGCVQRANSLHARVAVGSIRGIQLITTSDPACSRAFANRVIHWKSVITGNAKNVRDANVMQTRKHMLNHADRHKEAP